MKLSVERVANGWVVMRYDPDTAPAVADTVVVRDPDPLSIVFMDAAGVAWRIRAEPAE